VGVLVFLVKLACYSLAALVFLAFLAFLLS
jgi:hypothetical protein